MIHPPNRDTILALLTAAHRHGALFIMDEVKTGFRAPGGSMQAYYAITPDLTTVSKALGNGWPVAAVVGDRFVMSHAAGLHYSATYHGETAAMAAALATLTIIDRKGVQDTVWALDQQLIEGLNAAAADSGFPAIAYGEPIPPMPFLQFLHTNPAQNEELKTLVYQQVLAEGILLHPRHLWFTSAAHSPSDINRTVEAVGRAMATITQRAPELLAS